MFWMKILTNTPYLQWYIFIDFIFTFLKNNSIIRKKIQNYLQQSFMKNETLLKSNFAKNQVKRAKKVGPCKINKYK